MREIKFRIWDGKNKEWLGAKDKNVLTYYGFYLVGEVMNVQSPPHWELNEGSVVEQYTGCKDKNGKEIYEGDVLRLPENGDEEPELYAEVVYYQGSPRLKMGSHFTLLEEVVSYWSVAGNIHEKPELLKAKNETP